MNKKIHDIVIIGAGAAGCFAAYGAAKQSQAVLVLEANSCVAKKILATGGGRCNLNNTQPLNELINHYYAKGRFLHPAFQALPTGDFIKLCSDYGLKTRSDGFRLYPVSDKAKDVRNFLERLITHPFIDLRTESKVLSVDKLIDPDNRLIHVVKTANEVYYARRIILTAGGQALPNTGSDGSGFKIARDLGLNLTAIEPALSGLCTDAFPKDLSGVALQNVGLSLKTVLDGQRQKTCLNYIGNLLVTQFGISSPEVMNLSYAVPENTEVMINLDLFPNLNFESLAALIWSFRDKTSGFAEAKGDTLDTFLTFIFPKRIVPTLLTLAKIKPKIALASLNDKKIQDICYKLKNIVLKINGKRGFQYAQVTKGGVDLRQIDPKTLTVKSNPQLYLAGEILAVTGECGGYNLAMAFATGFLAGSKASEANKYECQ